MQQFAEAPRPDMPVARPRRRPIDVEAGFKSAMERFPKIIARLAE